MPPHSTLPGSPHLVTPYRGQAFQHPRTSVGAAGHWVKTVGILSPLLIHEMIDDPERRWRWIRIASVVTALGAEAMWTAKIHNERQEQKSWRGKNNQPLR